jgi:hypothetical protein
VPKLLEQYRERLRLKHYSLRTEGAARPQGCFDHDDLYACAEQGALGVKSPFDRISAPE